MTNFLGFLPRISLIIPARNEEAYLPRLLDTVDEAVARYHGGKESVEVVVADNSSSDATVEIARSRGCRVVSVEKRIIAAVRNGGARAARGQVLAFVDADARIHPETFNAIDRAFASGRVVAGATGVVMERMSLGIAAAYMMFIPLFWLTGMDTGTVFCRREDFEEVGGYNEERLFAEDVDFLLKLRRLGKSRGQKLTRLRSVKGIASTRKFDRHGEWHYLSMIFCAPYYLFVSRRSRDKFVQSYWYSDER